MGPDRFSYPPIPTDLPESKSEIGVVNKNTREEIPLTEFQEIKEEEKLPELKIPVEIPTSPEIDSQQKSETVSPENQDLLERRNIYLSNYRKWQETDKKDKQEKSRWSANSEASYVEYQQILKRQFEQELVAARDEFMKSKGVELAGEKLAVVKADLIRKYVILENAKLEEEKSEGWPPQEKGWWRTTLESYSKQPKSLKFAMSAAVGTAVAVSLPGVAVGGMVGLGGIASLRLARGISGYFVGEGVSKLISGILGSKLEKQSKEEKEKIISSDGSFEEIQKQHQDFLIKREKLKTRNKWLTVAAGLASGAGFSAASGVLENSVAGGLGLKNSVSVEDKIVDGRNIHPEPKNYMPGHAPEEQIKPDLGESVPVPDAELNYQKPPVKLEVKPEEFAPDQAADSKIVSPAEGSEALKEIQERTERLTVRKDEGFWQPVSREVEFRIKANPEKYGLSAEDVASEDSPELARAVARETNQILRSNKIIDSTGEIWISNPGAVVNLSEDGVVTTEGAILKSHDFAASSQQAAPESLGEESVPVTRQVESVRNFSNNSENLSRPVNVASLDQFQVAAAPSARAVELGDQQVAVGERNLSAFRNLQNSAESAAAAPESMEVEEPWRTEGLTAHEKLEPLLNRADELGDQMNEAFFLNIEKAPLSELEKYENILTGGQAEISEMEQLVENLKQDGLEPPDSYIENIEAFKEKLEHLAEIKAERVAQFTEFEKSLPPDYAANADLTLKQYLELESLSYDIPGQPSSRALEDFIQSADPSPSDMNLKLKDFLASRFSDGGFQMARPDYSPVDLTVRAQPPEISLAMKSHAQINLAKAELPQYSEDLNTILTAARNSSLAEFQKNFATAPEINLLKDDLTKICSTTAEKIRLLEESGWKVDPSIKESIKESIRRLQELDEVSDEYTSKWREWLTDSGFEKEEDYIRSIVEAKDNNGQPVVVDAGAVLDMSKNYTPSQMGKFAGFVEKVGELAKNLSPEELAEARKLPVDQFIKQNIKI